MIGEGREDVLFVTNGHQAFECSGVVGDKTSPSAIDGAWQRKINLKANLANAIAWARDRKKHLWRLMAISKGQGLEISQACETTNIIADFLQQWGLLAAVGVDRYEFLGVLISF